MVEHLTFNQRVAGSIPAGLTKQNPIELRDAIGKGVSIASVHIDSVPLGGSAC